jgi:hypothetical protein
MGQHLPDRLFWAREDGDTAETDTPETLAADAAESARRSDVRGTH